MREIRGHCGILEVLILEDFKASRMNSSEKFANRSEMAASDDSLSTMADATGIRGNAEGEDACSGHISAR
ncbi:MAG: hypothetical protein WA871_07610 [Candidatus Acidiferrales bacterium]